MTLETDTPAPLRSLEEWQAFIAAPPLHRFLALQAVSFDADRGEAILRLPLRPEFSRSAERLEWHGGMTATLIDIAGDYAIAALTGHGVPTINLRIDFLRMAGPSPLTATARVRKAGRTIGTVDVEVHDDMHRVIALGRGTYRLFQG